MGDNIGSAFNLVTVLALAGTAIYLTNRFFPRTPSLTKDEMQAEIMKTAEQFRENQLMPVSPIFNETFFKTGLGQMQEFTQSISTPNKVLSSQEWSFIQTGQPKAAIPLTKSTIEARETAFKEGAAQLQAAINSGNVLLSPSPAPSPPSGPSLADIQAAANKAGVPSTFFDFTPQGFKEINTKTDTGYRYISYATSTKYMLGPKGFPVLKASYLKGVYGL